MKVIKLFANWMRVTRDFKDSSGCIDQNMISGSLGLNQKCAKPPS